MSPRPFFSIIIPTFNARVPLKECLDSIADQDFRDFEVLVRDGGSSDGTREMLEHENRFPLNWESHEDQGVYDAMNEGVGAARGEYLIFLGADDMLANAAVLGRLEQAARDRECHIISGIVIYTDRENRLVPRFHKPAFGPSLRWRNRLHHQGTAYHRSLFANRGYDLRFPVLADYHFNLRIWKEVSPTSVMLDETIAHADATGLSKRFRWKLYKEELRLKKEVLSAGQMVLQYGWVPLKFLAKNLAQRT